MSALRLVSRLQRAIPAARAVSRAPNAVTFNSMKPAFGSFVMHFKGFSNMAGFPKSTSETSTQREMPLTTALPTEYEEQHMDRFGKGDPSKRAFTYAVLGASRFFYVSAARLVVIKIVATMSASADVLALAAVEVNIGNISEGQSATVKWRGKPIFIRHRTPEEIAEANAVAMTELRDQETDTQRTIDPKWLVLVGVCTHLGCVPIANAGNYNGWFCPCHGSHYDISGRIRLGPAPLNLEVPEYTFMDENTLKIG